MSIWKTLCERPTGQVRYSDFQPVRTLLSEEATGEVRDFTPDRNEEWALRAVVEVRYWANRAQQSDARKAAMGALASAMYGEQLSQLSYLKSAIYSGDAKAALSIIDKMEESMEEEGR